MNAVIVIVIVWVILAWLYLNFFQCSNPSRREDWIRYDD